MMSSKEQMKLTDYTQKHSFVICAYGESPYLEACIQSLLKQRCKSIIKMVTSTPNAHIKELASKYEIPLFINDGESGMVQDWNFGLNRCATPYVTIAHQDDIYFAGYTENALAKLRKSKMPLIFFSDYVEIRNKNLVKKNWLLQIKKGMLLPLRNKGLQKSIFVRRRILSFGNPICCPTVTLAVENLPKPIFAKGFRTAQDWEAWEVLSRLRGDFLYCNKQLLGHRIHSASETSAIIGENLRNKEDYEMFCKFWPKGIAKILARLYAKSEQSNEI